MDVDSHSSSLEPERVNAAVAADTRRPSASGSGSCHEGPLIDHVSQPLHLNDSSRTHNTQQQLELLPSHPFDLNFPTLNTDGSVDDLTSHQSRRHPTPPAALSALGARVRMASRDDGSESESSYSDNQFEMISHDELSEISSDDHDTASITSNDDGQDTPEYVGSDDEQEQEQTVPLDHILTASHAVQDGYRDQLTPPSTASSFAKLPSRSPADSSRIQQIKAENAIIDSYMSEDLETPRQSTMADAMPASGIPTAIKQPSPKGDDTKHILFFSPRNFPSKGISQEDMDLICSRVAACMHTGNESTHKVVRLPLTPTGIEPPSATAVCGKDTVSATIQHCIGAERRPFGSYGLRILDCDGQHSSIHTVGAKGKVELLRPDIAIFYINTHPLEFSEVDVAYQAIRSLKVPILLIHEQISSTWDIPDAFNKGRSYEQFNIEAGKFLDLKRASLRTKIQRLVKGEAGLNRRERILAKTSWVQFAFPAFIILLYLGLTMCVGFSDWDPAIALPARREALIASLKQATVSANVTKEFNIEHLVPSLPAECYSKQHSTLAVDCEPKSHLQGVSPNHVVLSLPGKQQYPQAISTKVYKSDGRLVGFNQTKLIDGIYLLTLDPAEAYGNVNVNMVTKGPELNVTGSHNFGRQMLKKCEQTSIELTKEVGKEVAVMRQAAKILSSKLSADVGAGIWATKNVTTQIAVYVARELQVFGGTAASMLGKAAEASNQTATTLSKDLMLMQKDIVKYTKELTKSMKSQVKSVKSNSKALIQSRLSISRERIGDLRRALERNRDAEAESVSKAIKRCGVANIPKQIKSLEKELEKITPQLAALERAAREVRNSEQEIALLKKQATEEADGSKMIPKAQIRKLLREIKEKERALTDMRKEMDRKDRKH